MPLIQKILILFISGGIGTLCRYGLQGAVQRAFSPSLFPWGTMSVNILGSLLFGLFWALTEQKLIPPEARLAVLSGFMGAFTTFSTFMFETGDLIRESEYAFAALNLTASNTVGLVFFFIGLFIGKAF